MVTSPDKKEGQNCHPGRYQSRLQWMQSSGDQKFPTNLRDTSQINNPIGNVQCLQSDQPKESEKSMKPGQKHKLVVI